MSLTAETHTYWRTMWLLPCFLLGTYNTLIYDQFNENIYETSPSLRLLPAIFISYLGWDIYVMMFHKQLYRTDLMTHHSMCFVIYSFGLYYNTFKIGSLFMLCESISLLNYLLRNHPTYLNYYRVFTVVCIRMPIWFGCVYVHYNHYYDLPITTGILFKYGPTLFILYDIFILCKIKQKQK